MKKYLSILFFFSLAGSLFAQNPAAGLKQTDPIAIENATIHVGNGEVIENGGVLFENGIITQVGKLGVLPVNVIKLDAAGKKLYPGIISPYSTLGLNEIAAVRTTQDYRELGDVKPNVRAYIAHNTDSEVIPTVRGNGVLIGQTTPLGGLVPGKSGVMNYDGWNWEDAALKTEDGLWINWPSEITRSYDRSTRTSTYKKNKKYEEQLATLESLFGEAKAYDPSNSEPNPKLSAVKALWSSDMRLYVTANRAKEIVATIKFADKFEISNLVLVGAEEVMDVLGFVKEREIPVLIPATHALPSKSDTDIWEPYKKPAKLMEAGLLIGMYYNQSYWRTRNLPFVAGSAAAHGLGKERALQMITLNNAKILGVGDLVGSIEVGKRATLVLSEGDILDMMTAKVTHAFINGKVVDLDDKQKRLNSKYLQKYGIE